MCLPADSEEGYSVQEVKVSLLKQKNHIPLTVLSIVLCIVLSPVLGSLMMLPQVLTLLPVVLMALLAFVGPVSCFACCAVLIALAFSLFGAWAAVCMALLLVPTIAASVITLERGDAFWTAAAAGCVAMFASMGAALGLISVLAGSDVVTAMMGLISEMLSSYGTLSDFLLSMLIQMGAIAAPEGFDAAAGVLSIDAATRTEMISSLVMLMDSMLRLEIPQQMATGSIAAGVFGQALLRVGAGKKGIKTEYPPLRTWRVPKGWGRILGGTLVLLFVLSQLLPETMSTMFYVFSGIFDQVFALQGIAAVSYMLHEHQKKARWQVIAFILGYTLLRSPAVILGIFDQAADFTHRREKLDKDENPFDPRKNLV